jgi:hypothetical protein
MFFVGTSFEVNIYFFSRVFIGDSPCPYFFLDTEGHRALFRLAARGQPDRRAVGFAARERTSPDCPE